MMKLKALTLALILAAGGWLGNCQAQEDSLLVIRRWPGNGFTVETMWDLHVGIGINAEAAEMLPRPLDANMDELDKKASQMMFVVERNVNETETSVNRVTGFSFGAEENKNKIMMTRSWPESPEAGTQFGATKLHSGSLSVRFCDHDGYTSMGRRSGAGGLDATSKNEIVVATGEEFDEEFLTRHAKQLRPIMMIVNDKLESVGGVKVKVISHNSIAVSPRTDPNKPTRFVRLGTEPYKLSDELEQLFRKKEAAQKATMNMFKQLSVKQMNFEPSNGSHTPRWNAEHMMGRELVFFSQIYNAMDNSIPVMDLNPKQMPKDYKFAHPDWSGGEEARQIERVQNFTRRFAYLLDGMDLDKKAPGSRFWTPRKLLIQMDRHYNEHSANVRKKMELSDWPKPETSNSRD
jgi:hypothetical protein